MSRLTTEARERLIQELATRLSISASAAAIAIDITIATLPTSQPVDAALRIKCAQWLEDGQSLSSWFKQFPETEPGLALEFPDLLDVYEDYNMELAEAIQTLRNTS